MKKNTVKIILDIIITMLFLLMYSKNAVNMRFHEVGGLIVFGLFLVHKMLNWDWIAQTTKKLFSKTLPGRARLCYILNVLLFVSVTFIIVSGLFMAETINIGLPQTSFNWRVWHYFASAVALAITGIHIGLNWGFIQCMFGKVVRLPKTVGKVMGTALLAAVLLFGIFGLIGSNYARWLTGPFSGTLSFEEGHGFGQADGNGGGRGTGLRDGSGGGHGFGRGADSSAAFAAPDPARMAGVIGSFGAITVVFASATVLADKTIRGKGKPAC
jgi:hypothetical protein